MNSIKHYIGLITIASILTLSSCKPECERHPDNPECLGENELITTLTITFTDSATNSVSGNFSFRDIDGAGGNLPSIDTIILEQGKTYIADVTLANESTNPIQDLTPEITQEKDEHLFVFIYSGTGILISYSDLDNNGLPIGLRTLWDTHGNPTSGNVTVTLRHQPGVKDGTPLPGDTDAEIQFPVIIQ